MRMEMIRLEHVTKSFGRYKALDDVSIVVEEGEFLTVIGRSGCGKTTMLRMINGLQKPDSGKVYAAGLDVVSEEPISMDNPLLSAPNCIITPHIAWAAKESRAKLLDLGADNLAAFAAGNPVNQVN